MNIVKSHQSNIVKSHQRHVSVGIGTIELLFIRWTPCLLKRKKKVQKGLYYTDVQFKWLHKVSELPNIRKNDISFKQLKRGLYGKGTFIIGHENVGYVVKNTCFEVGSNHLKIILGSILKVIKEHGVHLVIPGGIPLQVCT